MAKKNECELRRSSSYRWTTLKIGKSNIIWYDWPVLRKVAPVLCKGLRPGQSRKLVLTQTKRGIKLEVKK